MPKFFLSQCVLLLLCCSSWSLANAYSGSTYRHISLSDEIKQSEKNASQAVLDALSAHTDTTDTDNISQQNQTEPESSIPTPDSRSNTDKAFRTLDDKSANSTSSANKNPWLQPNPWAKQPPNIWDKNAKINPYSNAPIPGPTPSINSAVLNPPNIFAPSQPSTNTKQNQPNVNSKKF